MQVEIYTMKNCIHCKEAKAYLTEKGITFKEFDMGKGGDSTLWEKKKEFRRLGLKTYPVTIIISSSRSTFKNSILQGFNKKEFDEVFGNE